MIVVQDIFFTETASYADVIFPASAWPEKNGTVTNTNRQIQMGRKAIDCPGEAKEDWLIIIELANRLGLKWKYSHPKDIFNEMKNAMPSLNNITWDRLEKEHSVTYPLTKEGDPGKPVIFEEGFLTENGKALLVPAQFSHADELPDQEFPLVFVTVRQLEH